jgi:phage shock protein PspC (stress-responsive transcriptional regulator)
LPPDYAADAAETAAAGAAVPSLVVGAGTGDSGGGAFAVWLLRRELFHAFRAGGAGHAHAVHRRGGEARLLQRRLDKQAAARGACGGVALALQWEVARQVRVGVGLHGVGWATMYVEIRVYRMFSSGSSRNPSVFFFCKCLSM